MLPAALLFLRGEDQKTAVIDAEAGENVLRYPGVRGAGINQGFDLLEAPIERIGGMDAPYPPARYEKLYLPDVDRILEAADVALAYG